jgi:hypothetical protein
LFHSVITEITDTLQELQRLTQLNYELLEQLNVACGYLQELRAINIVLPNEEKFANLLSKAIALLAEIQAKSPKMLQYQKLSDDSYHDNDDPTKSYQNPEQNPATHLRQPKALKCCRKL